MSETRIGLTDEAKAIFDVRARHHALLTALRALDAEMRQTALCVKGMNHYCLNCQRQFGSEWTDRIAELLREE